MESLDWARADVLFPCFMVLSVVFWDVPLLVHGFRILSICCALAVGPVTRCPGCGKWGRIPLLPKASLHGLPRYCSHCGFEFLDAAGKYRFREKK